MSRRRGEFEHRTSIFEGAFRAWSHLGGLDPLDLENKPASDLDPLTNPITNDQRLYSHKKGGGSGHTADGRREYPYEPLPRSGLAHPYVQAILSPWLGPDADNEAIQLGLTTLRTWWQHRRKGESGSAVAALGTEKMKGVVEGYTRHFFTLAHCLVVNDKEQPPRTLHTKMKELDKARKKGNKKRARDDQVGKIAAMAAQTQGPSSSVTTVDQSLAASLASDLTDSNLSPLERLHAAQRRQLAESGGLQSHQSMQSPIINLKGKCIPGKIDLPGVVDAVNRAAATQLAHRGAGVAVPSDVSSSGIGFGPDAADPSQYGDPNKTPIVYVSTNGDVQIAMAIDGITCAHCVKIVETVLKGCNGNKSPIEGLLDAAADRVMNSVLIKIDHVYNAKRVAFEAARNLSMVGYTGTPKEMSIAEATNANGSIKTIGQLMQAFELVANVSVDTHPVFDWTMPCSCPDNGVSRQDCSRHTQMSANIFEAFERRRHELLQFVASEDGSKIGSGNGHLKEDSLGPLVSVPGGGGLGDPFSDVSIQIDQQMDFSFGMEPPPVPAAPPPPVVSVNAVGGTSSSSHPSTGAPTAVNISGGVLDDRRGSRSQRNPSILSYGNGLRNMSLASDATFGRAMSGLSALSIDWENLEDFDVEVDHSAHINNSPTRNPANDGRRRSSLRRSLMSTGDSNKDGAHVSFKV